MTKFGLVSVCASARGTNLFETEYGPLAKSFEELKGNLVAVWYEKCFEFIKKEKRLHKKSLLWR